MNTIEHNQVEREEIKGLKFGFVIQSDDSENMHRVKVRVRGVFNEPIKKDDIPWALPLIDCAVPTLGDEVCVIFENDDIERPRYFPKTILDKARKEEFDSLYAAIVDAKKGSVKSGVSVVDSSFSEPATGSEGTRTKDVNVKIYPEDVATETGETVDTGSPSNGVMVEVNKKKGEESVSVYHPTGTFIDIQKDGTIIIHGVKNIFAIADGDLNGVIEGKALLKVTGNVELKVDGGVKIKTVGDLQIEAPNIKLTGGKLKVDGTVAPTGSGPFCALPSCLFTGAPHVGNEVTGT